MYVRRVEVGPPFGVFKKKTCGRSQEEENPLSLSLSTRPKIVRRPPLRVFVLLHW